MKRSLVSMVAMFTVAGLLSVASAADKEQTFKGKVECGKCALKETKACQNVLSVTDASGKETKYYLEGQASKDFHGKVCKAPKDNVSVTGAVSEKNGKKVIHVSKIEG